jgi:hypothetical protein
VERAAGNGSPEQDRPSTFFRRMGGKKFHMLRFDRLSLEVYAIILCYLIATFVVDRGCIWPQHDGCVHFDPKNKSRENKLTISNMYIQPRQSLQTPSSACNQTTPQNPSAHRDPQWLQGHYTQLHSQCFEYCFAKSCHFESWATCA